MFYILLGAYLTSYLAAFIYFVFSLRYANFEKYENFINTLGLNLHKYTNNKHNNITMTTENSTQSDILLNKVDQTTQTQDIQIHEFCQTEPQSVTMTDVQSDSQTLNDTDVLSLILLETPCDTQENEVPEQLLTEHPVIRPNVENLINKIAKLCAEEENPIQLTQEKLVVNSTLGCVNRTIKHIVPKQQNKACPKINPVKFARLTHRKI